VSTRQVAHGHIHAYRGRALTGREVTVLQLAADGLSNVEIGGQVGLSALTVKSHLVRIGAKLGTGNRTHMVALALRRGTIA